MKTTIKFPKSDSFAFLVTINKIANALDNAFFTVKENPDEEPVLQKKLGAGISLADSRLYKNQLSYKVQIDGADTQLMEVGVRYFFDVKGTIGNAQKTFLWGELILSETETGYLNPAMQGDTVAVAQVYTATFETVAQSQYVETEVDPVATAKIGDMTKLNTTAKDTIVKAVNEVRSSVVSNTSEIKEVMSSVVSNTIDINGIKDGTIVVKKSTVALYASDDSAKGTIEERLTNLGFKESAVELSEDFAEHALANNIKRQGNYVIGNIDIVSDTTNQIRVGSEIGVIPVNFRPKTAETFIACALSTTNSPYTKYWYSKIIFKIDTDGKIIAQTVNSDTYMQTNDNKYLRGTSTLGQGNFDIFFAYEASPIS